MRMPAEQPAQGVWTCLGVVGIHPANAVGDDIEADAGTGTVLGELAGSGGEKESR